MNKDEFSAVKERLNNYKHTSMKYVQYEHIEKFDVLQLSSSVLLCAGKNAGTGHNELHWAANESEDIIEAAKHIASPVYVSFVPEAWVKHFAKAGFVEYFAMRDYWIRELSADMASSPYSHLECSEYAAAFETAHACRWQSRGFSGESLRWITSWMDGTNADAAEARDCTILACREGKRVAGIICVGIYGDDNPRGAVLWVRMIAVHPDYQGQGIGKALLQQGLQYGIDHGTKRAFLLADELNKGAIGLYRQVGFVPADDDAQIDMLLED